MKPNLLLIVLAAVVAGYVIGRYTSIGPGSASNKIRDQLNQGAEQPPEPVATQQYPGEFATGYASTPVIV